MPDVDRTPASPSNTADPALDRFHPLIADWFRAQFAGPTAVQREGWAAIASRRHALLCAPTGSGKTLAAFLTCIDDLLRAGLAGNLPDHAEVVYVSPLKALSNDVRKNLEQPLLELARLAEARGLDFPAIRVATRTGDTPARERQANAKRPPHIWITTPESLFVLLGSESGRRGLAGVRTVIVDEIHAVADDKRGSHLALSLARLEALCAGSLTRIGLSATVNPIEEVARLLVGPAHVDAAGRPDCVIVDEGARRKIDLEIELPPGELGPIATHEIWKDVLDRVAELTKAVRTTLVFVNTRRLVERVAHQLAERLGEDTVAAHHGSLSRETRLKAEERLKHGLVRVCVATASLELGIDVGTVDLVCQIGTPRSVAVAMQRIGRSGHAVGRTPVGRLFPLTRDELLECVTIGQMLRDGRLERLEVPPWPLDVLAQQVVAACAVEPWDIEGLFALVRGTWPYRELPRDKFDQVIDMLSDGYASSLGRKAAWLHRDAVNGELRARRGAGLAALTSGGAIPDNADYDVIAEPDNTLVGRIHEDFAIESLAGDVFLLGNTSWRIRRVERGVVRVEDAAGNAPTIPFWLGEAPSRTYDVSISVGDLREEVDRRLDQPGEAEAWLREVVGLSAQTAARVVAYVMEGKRILGVVPTAKKVVAERFFDEAGGMQLVIHAPFGGRINRAWGLALRKRFCRSFDFELQAAATDEGINLSIGPQHSFPLADIFRFVTSRTAEEVLVQAVLQSPIFATRWRWTASRALAILRSSGGKKVPPPLQRMRSDDLLAAVFPGQVACQDNNPGDVELPDQPLVFESMRDALHDALDLDGLVDVLKRMEDGQIELFARDTPQPSVFAHQILNAMPYAFLDDAPLEERRARAVALRRALPEDSRDLGRLDPEAIDAAREDAWQVARDPDELHDALLGLIVLPRAQLADRFGPESERWIERLERARRVVHLDRWWVAAERLETARAAIEGDVAALTAVVRGWAEAIGPFSEASLAALLGLGDSDIAVAAATLEGQGTLLRGDFTGGGEAEWCDRRILSRIHRATVARLRREIEPVSVADYLRFLASWQHLSPGSRLDGPGGILEAVGRLQGFEAAAGAWEVALLPARMNRYDRLELDRLCLSGAIVWGRFTPRGDGSNRRGPLTRAAPLSIGLREDLPWLLDAEAGEEGLSSRAALVLGRLRRDRASFFADLAQRCRLLNAEVEDALGELVASGLISCDSFGPLRKVVRGASSPERRPRSAFAKRNPVRPQGEGRWWVFEREDPDSVQVEPTAQARSNGRESAKGTPGGTPGHLPGGVDRLESAEAFAAAGRERGPDRVEARAAQLLRRYGVLCRDLLAREPFAPPWRELLEVLRRAESRGELRGGRFITGVGGIQFALPEAVKGLRDARRQEARGELVGISACDPLNLAGILTPGPRVTAVLGNRLVLRDGRPVAWLEGDKETFLDGLTPQEVARAKELLHPSIRPAAIPSARVWTLGEATREEDTQEAGEG